MPPRSQAYRIKRATLRTAPLASRGAAPTKVKENDRAPSRASARILQRVVYLGLVIAISVGVQQFLADPSFQVTRVDVRGAHYLSSATVTQAAAVTGTTIFRVSARAARERVLMTGVPRSVLVQVTLPGTVTIVVNERTAAYLWTSGSSTYAVSDDGTILGLATTDRPAVSVVDLDAGPMEVGKAVDVHYLREAAYVAEVVPTTAGFKPSSVSLSADLGILVETPDHLTVAIGDDTNLPDKLAALGPTLFAARWANPAPTTLDLRFVGHPVFR